MKSRKPTTLLQIFSVATILVATHESSLAFGGPPGGPFSNGSYFPNDGTFSAIVRGRNLTGTLQFSTTGSSGPVPSSVEQQTSSTGSSTTQSTISRSAIGGVGSTGISTIYFNGDTMRGDAQGTINANSSQLNITFQAGAPGQGQQTIVVSKEVTNTTTSNGTTTTTTTTIPTKTILYFDSLYLSGFAECKTSNAFPNQKFQGGGEAEFQFLTFDGNTPLFEKSSRDITVSGVRLSNVASSFADSNVVAPSVNEFSLLE